MKKCIKFSVFSLIILGCASGFINGLFGTGGGAVMMLGLAFILGRKRDKRNIFAEVAAVTLVLSAVSAVIYFKNGRFPINDIPKYCIPAIFGGLIGSFLLDRLPSKLLGKLFSLLLIIGGGIMLFK